MKFLKHGLQCLSLSIEREILLSCADISPNTGPVQASLSCWHQNARSLKAVHSDGASFESKLTILQDISYGFDVDVICLTETWLNGTL